MYVHKFIVYCVLKINYLVLHLFFPNSFTILANSCFPLALSQTSQTRIQHCRPDLLLFKVRSLTISFCNASCCNVYIVENQWTANKVQIRHGAEFLC